MSDADSPTVSVSDALAQQLADAAAAVGQLLRDQLTESQRLATIGTIAAVIAHEFNNLLTPVVSYSQFALARSNAESEKAGHGVNQEGSVAGVPKR